ncbi:hypothetical protein [Ensifer sp. ENS11]|nr:hypothetical protein [Ensifer sp. ENS11]MBD9491981.1 hypothetical protein [Ensifer sp. ENS11]
MIAGKDDGERVVHLATLDERFGANSWPPTYGKQFSDKSIVLGWTAG